MRAVRKLAAWILGAVFFLSGFLKLIDPVGTSLVFTEYFKFLHLPFLIPMSGLAGKAMSFFETILGITIITGVWRKIVAIASGAVMLFFTGLTLALYIVNPEMSCGCFGEAIHLTHAQSFYKNIILDILWILAFIPFKKMGRPEKIKYVSFGIATGLVVLYTVNSWLSVPAADFTPMAVGAELMHPQADFVSGAPVLSFCDMDGEYVDSLALDGRVLAVSVYDPAKLTPASRKRVMEFVGDASRLDVRRTNVMLLQPFASPVPDSLASHAYYADRRILMTLNRSNGGLTYINDGQIVRKWSRIMLPDLEEIPSMLRDDPVDVLISGSTGPKIRVQAFVVIIFAIMLIL